MSRRRFVGVSAVTGAGILGAKVFGAGSTSAPGNATNPTFKIGGDLEVNRLGFGAILIAEALHPYPKGLIIATKGGLTRPGPGDWEPNGHPDYLKGCVDKSLKRLRLDRIDLYQLHTVDPKVPMEQSLGALKEMQGAGKIRHVGLSNVSPEQIARARKVLPIVSVQNRYNLGDRKSEKAIDYCEKENLGFLPWFPVGGGRGVKSAALDAVSKAHGVTVYQVALAWLLQRSPVMLPIPGTSNIQHLEDNVAAAKLKLTPEEWKTLAG